MQQLVFFIVFLFFLFVFILIMRAIGAWMLRINEVIRNQEVIIEQNDRANNLLATIAEELEIQKKKNEVLDDEPME